MYTVVNKDQHKEINKKHKISTWKCHGSVDVNNSVMRLAPVHLKILPFINTSLNLKNHHTGKYKFLYHLRVASGHAF